MTLTKVNKTLHPNNHFLDIMTNIRTKGGEVFDLSCSLDHNNMHVSFLHKFPHSEVVFEENILYDESRNIVHWKTTTPYECVTIYSR
ncbi:MAG TPA: hypothetical protein DCW76_02100 [Lysinibacillus sp.]|nr:hypothetical protein [Lysinibacillus sp.]